MTQWGPFLAVTAVSLVVLLVLARRSQQVIGDDGQLSPATAPRSPERERGPASRDLDIVHNDATTPVEREKPPEDTTGLEPVTQSTPAPRPSSHHESQSSVELTTELLFLNVAFTQGLVVVILVATAWYFAVPAAAFGIAGEQTVSGVATLPVGAAFGLLLWIGNEIATALADAVGAAYDEAIRELLAPESPGGWVVLFGAVLPVIALGEELLFRGALVGIPHAGYGVSLWLLAALSSVAFALGHGAQGRVGVIVTGLLGFVLAAGYVVTGSLVVVVVAHYVINALEFFVHELLDIEDSTVERVGALNR